MTLSGERASPDVLNVCRTPLTIQQLAKLVCAHFKRLLSLESLAKYPRSPSPYLFISLAVKMPGADFEAAVSQSRNLKAKPTDDELLQVGGSETTLMHRGL